MYRVFAIFLLIPALAISQKAEAKGVTYLNCPTLKPLPVTNFMPAAMLPIKNTQTAFDVGMNVTIKNAVTFAATTTINAINSNTSTLIESSIKISRAQHEQELEMEKQFERIKQAYQAHLSSQLQQSLDLAFPGDPAVSVDMSPAPGDSPTLKFARNMCTTAKMNQYARSNESKDKVARSINRRNQKIVHSISAVSNVNAAAKQSIDMHYDLFCSEQDFNNALCKTVSVAPNADISAFNFLYPSGGGAKAGAGTGFSTQYTYNPIESLAAYQYIKNIAGTLHSAPPSESEKRDGTRALFAAVYTQGTSALSMASDVLLEISQLREPLNSSGLRMSSLDILAYQIEKNNDPNHRRIISSSTETGKLIEKQRQMAINNQLRLLLLKQRDAMRRIQAADIAISSTIDALSE